jgi:sugar phosphate isomerase/epimerase
VRNNVEKEMDVYTEKIRIGTLVSGSEHGANYIRQIWPYGFESFSITFWQTLQGADLKKLAREVNEALAGSGAVISCIGVFGNPLGERPIDAESRDAWTKLIDAAHLFGCNLVTGFAGRVVDRPIDESIPRYAEVFGPLAKRAADKGVRLAFENCDMGGDWHRGDWNIAHGPTAWEMMFNAIPSENVGLEWEPCHQMVKLIDPMPQLRKWVGRIFHVHGKDATVLWDVIREHGIHGSKQFAFHRTPGFGDSNWTDIISELRRGGFAGSIDIEGWHDPVYREELEMTGQVHGLNYLKQCRTTYVLNPVAK